MALYVVHMRYYGCKLKLLDYINDTVKSLNLPEGSKFFDIFSGTSSVGQHFKKLGYTVYANDFLEFAYAIAYSSIKLNEEPKFDNLNGVDKVLEYLNLLPKVNGFITNNYSPLGESKRQYLSIENAQKTDAIREKINEWKSENIINEDEYYYLIATLINAINLVSNVTGTYAAYLKNWDSRALKPMKLVKYEIIPSPNKNLVTKGDANEIVAKYDVDILYLDPPYNSRQFASNYFFLELIAEGWFKESPKIYGVTGMRPYEHQKSKYSQKEKAGKVLQDLVQNARARYILLSYNNEGIIPVSKLREILSLRGKVTEFSKPHKRYRAINQDGSLVVTEELLFLVEVNK